MSPFRLPQLARLTRLDSSFFIFGVVFAPMILKGHGISESIAIALPLLTTSMCAFALNDIRDTERDQINHKNRPLASGSLSIKLAMGAYFTLLVGTLVWLRIYVDAKLIWPYILYLVVLINYNFVIDEFTYLKNIVVSVAILMPIIILDNALYGRVEHVLVLPAVFVFIFAREMLMDIKDAAGDGKTLFKFLGEFRATKLAFSLQTLSIVVLLVGRKGLINTAIGGFLLLVLAFSVLTWFQGKKGLSIKVMKLQLIAGIGYLI